jgi:hypothetical protein
VTVLALAALVLGLVLTAGGCSSDAEPSPMPTPPSSPSEPASESPSATPPAMPAEASGTSPAAAKAFVRHWITSLNYASSTGDTAAVQALSAPDCESCTASFDRIAAVYANGGSIRSDGWRVRTMKLVPGQSTNEPMIDVGIRLTPQVVVERRGSEPQEFDGGRLPMTFTLSRDLDSWRVTRLERSA